MLNRERKFELVEKAEEVKAEKEAMDNQIYQLKRELEVLKDELKTAEFDRFEADKNRDILATLYEQNFIDREGKPT